MKKWGMMVLSFSVTLIIVYSCGQDDKILPQNPVIDTNLAMKITLDGISVQDTLTVQYESSRVKTIDWCTRIYGECINGYSEQRYYSESKKLDSIRGLWDITYNYENGFRKDIVAYRDDAFYSTTKFLEYRDSLPSKMEVEFASSEISYVDLTFSSAGDLVHKVIRNGNGEIVEDVQIDYTNIDNPLRGIIESVSIAVEFFGFDDFAFYYSKHVPKTVTIMEVNSAVFPKNQVINYNTETDAQGRLVVAGAFRNQNNIHNLKIHY